MNTINEIQREIYEALSASYDTYDIPDADAKLPFVRIGDISWEKHKEKVFGIECYNIRQEIHVWSDYEGKKEVLEISEDVEGILEGISYDDYSVINNEVISTQINDLDGYKQAVIMLDLKLDN